MFFSSFSLLCPKIITFLTFFGTPCQNHYFLAAGAQNSYNYYNYYPSNYLHKHTTKKIPPLDNEEGLHLNGWRAASVARLEAH
jgi:hypothetical protein